MRALPPAGLLLIALAGPASAQADPGARLPPDAANTRAPSDSVGTTGQVPSTAYPGAPTPTPAAEGADRGRPPTEAEKAGR